MNQNVRFAKFVLLVNCLVPGSLLLGDALHGHAGANPVNYAILTTGMLALIFLSLTLVVTPLRKITGFNFLFHFRRTLGLFAFFYALSHFSIFFIFDRDLSISSTLSEMVKRKFLIIGSLALLSMVPLAATSFNSMIKRLGPKRWQLFHRLVYVVAILGAIHFYMQVKSDIRKPLTFLIIINLLLAYRLAAFLVTRRKESTATGTNSPNANRWTGALRVDRITRETPNVLTFRFVPTNSDPFPFAYLPGQYLTIALTIAGKTVRRNYTIASTPSRPGFCELTIKREPQGLASGHMHEAIKEGDILSIAAPSGKESPFIALLAAGVGITPLMAILRYLTDQNYPGHIYLLYSNKTEADIIFLDEIETLRKRFPNLHVLYTLTRATPTIRNARTGRIDSDLISKTIPNPTSIPFFLCGPPEMLKSTRTLLQQLGVPDFNIHVESFGARPSESALDIKNSECLVTFSRSHQSASIGNRSILELAEHLQIPIDFECRSGICGRCKCKLAAGSVFMQTQDALTPLDFQNHLILLCQARPLENVTIDA